MWFKKASPRRQAIREDLAEMREADPARGRKRQMFLVMLTFGLLAACLQFWPRNPMPYRVGEKSPMDLRAPVAFRFVDPQLAAEARRNARENTEQVISVDEDTVRLIGSQLVALRNSVENVTSVGQLPVETRRRFPSLSVQSLAALKAIDQQTFIRTIDTFMMPQGGGLRAVPLISHDDRATLLKRQQNAIVRSAADSIVRLAPTDSIDVKWNLPTRDIDQLLVCDERGVDPAARAPIRNLVGQGGEISETQADFATDAIMSLTRPLYKYDSRLSAQLADQRANNVHPDGKDVAKDAVIVPAGTEIDTAGYQEMIQAQDALEQSIAQTAPWAPWFNRLGLALTTFILTAAGAFYVSRAAPTITIRRAWAIAGLLWITLAAAKVIALYWPIGLLAIAPTLLVAIILVIAENPRFSLGMAALHGLLVTFTIRQGIDFYIPLLAGTAIFCFGLREIRTRGKLIEIGALAGIGIFAATWAIGASRLMGLAWSRWIASTDIGVTWNDSLWGAGAGVAVAMFALAILPSIERIFKITTAMTLLELCDANKPLMRRLSQEAAGTFSHSLTVGIMAEAAGNAIGANGLLCRVGAYYHDVGKLSKPQYFIENQNPGHPNRHDKLSPAMSLLIIVGHVKDGIELAREYGLPWVIHQFIAQHHGTTLVEYFFHAARKRAAKDEDSAGVSESEFRYPGPRPQTPEAAIVMICDSCESVVRSIEEPTPGRIESAVHNMIMKRLLDGQFSECDMTLRDLSIIEETLVRTLAGVHHGRVSYPGRSDDRPSDIGISQPA